MRTGLIVSLATASVIGCGFDAPDGFSGRRIGDGIAPWRHLGAPQVCLGNSVVGSPSAPGGGMCDPLSVQRPLCLSDDDCASRETCVCGSCVVQYCTSNDDCSGDRVCHFGSIDGNRCDSRCTTNNDCSAGEICRSLRCIARCIEDSDCQSGEFCAMIGLERRCAVRSCEIDDDCPSGQACRIQRVPRVATEPTVLRIGDEIVMWVELSEPFAFARRAIYRAVSNDGLRFQVSPAAPVIVDGNDAHAPAVVYTGDEFVAYYQFGDGDEIRSCTSPDGVNFGPAETVITADTWTVRSPAAAVLPGGTIAVYYEVGDGQAIARLGVGSVLFPDEVEDPSTDGPDGQFWIDVTAVHSPSVRVAPGEDGEPALQLWFAAMGRETESSRQLGEVVPSEANLSIGYASGHADDPDALTVWPFNPVFDRVDVFVNHRSELAPTVVNSAGERYMMYFTGVDSETGRATLGMASNGE